jgi:hypothetical protein
MPKRFVAVVACVAWMSTTVSQGAPIATRAALNSLLGGGGITEGFEAYSLGANSNDPVGSVYNASSTPNGQGPGLVVPGISFSRPGNNLIIMGTTSFGGNSQRLIWDSNTSNPITFDFLASTTAFGVDLLTIGGTTGPTTVTVFGSDDSTVLATFPGVGLNSNPQTPVFFGYEDANGIGSIRFSLTAGGPAFDNVTFGIAAALPEPASLALWSILGLTGGIGAWRRRRANVV